METTITELVPTFQLLLPFLLVYALTYAALLKFELISKEKSINALIAFVVAAMFLFSKSATAIIFIALPWLAIVLFGLFIIYMLLIYAGVDPDAWKRAWSNELDVPHYILFTIIAVVFLYTFSSVMGGNTAAEEDNIALDEGSLGVGQATAGESMWDRVAGTFTNPTVLLLLLFLILAAIVTSSLS